MGFLVSMIGHVKGDARCSDYGSCAGFHVRLRLFRRSRPGSDEAWWF